VKATPVRDYIGDLITISVGGAVIEATGNHPFLVVSGEDLANRPLAQVLSANDQVFNASTRWVEVRNHE